MNTHEYSILMIGGEENLARILADQLREQDIRLTHVSTSEKLTEANIAPEAADLIIIGSIVERRGVPDPAGLIRRFKEDNFLRPVILMTGGVKSLGDPELTPLREAGVNDIIIHPVDIEQLLGIVKKWLKPVASLS